jgi:ssDNA-specific exonuclease RecJ
MVVYYMQRVIMEQYVAIDDGQITIVTSGKYSDISLR